MQGDERQWGLRPSEEHRGRNPTRPNSRGSIPLGRPESDRWRVFRQPIHDIAARTDTSPARGVFYDSRRQRPARPHRAHTAGDAAWARITDVNPPTSTSAVDEANQTPQHQLPSTWLDDEDDDILNRSDYVVPRSKLSIETFYQRKESADTSDLRSCLACLDYYGWRNVQHSRDTTLPSSTSATRLQFSQSWLARLYDG
jgi:hypothetical protein